MLNTCPACGEYSVDQRVDVERDEAVCPTCGHRRSFVRADLLLVGGASGAGKTTVCERLIGALPEAVLLDSDILWSDADAEDATAFFERWLRVCTNLAQNGTRVVLFGAGTGLPENLESCRQRRFVGELHALALVCDDDVLTERLRRRPAWRRSGSDAYVDEHVRFNRWLRENGPRSTPPIAVLDATVAAVDDTTAEVAIWIRERLAAHV